MRKTSLALAALLSAVACAHAPPHGPLGEADARAEERGAGARTLAEAGFYSLFVKGDAAEAARRFRRAEDADARDPWARYGAALLARRSLDDEAEAAELAALVAGAPAHPLAGVAARRLGELAEIAPPLNEAAVKTLAPLLARNALQGENAYRARVALLTAAQARGDDAAAAPLRAQGGAITSWALSGPWGSYHALEFDKRFPPEDGTLSAPPARPGVLAPGPVRALDAASGAVTLDGEPPSGGDIFYLASDVTLSRGGRYLVYVATGSSAKAWVDGELVADRRAFEAYSPVVTAASVELAGGVHHLLVKLSRGADRGAVSVALARADGAASDVTSAAPRPGSPLPPARAAAGPLPSAGGTRALAAALAKEVGGPVADFAAARDGVDLDREAAKDLVADALAELPGAPVLRALRGDVLRDDPTLEPRIAHARAESDYDAALATDPGDSATRLKRAELARAADRLDAAHDLLAALPPADAARPRGLYMRARLASSRGFVEGAGELAEQARRKDGHCLAVELLYDLARRRDAVAREDDLAAELGRCPGGRERLAEHLRERGAEQKVAELWRAMVAGDPLRIEPRLFLAQALVALGDAAGAAAELEQGALYWPRSALLQKRLADAYELGGEPQAARAAREKALSLDGADLQLRRALALQDGKEVLADFAEDGRAAIAAYEKAGKKFDTSSVVVLDGAAIEANPDGSQTERIHQVIHVLDQEGVEKNGEVQVPPQSQVLYARTIKKDGRVLEPEEAGGEKGSLSLTGLDAGDYVEYEYLHATPPRGAALPGWTAEAFYFRTPEQPLWRSSYVVLGPEGGHLETDAHNMHAVPITREKGFEAARALFTDVPAFVPEPNAPSANEYLPFLLVGAGAGRDALQLAYADGLADRSRPTRELETFAREAAQGKQGEALVRAVYDKVASTILGESGGWGDSASQVLSRGRGNRTMLLKAALDVLGVKSHYALVRPFGADPAHYRFPRPENWSYAVLRVELPKKTLWLDLTTRLTPFGVLPAGVRDCDALVVPEPGEAPATAKTPGGGEDGREIDAKIALGADGSATVSGTERYVGYDGASAKAAVERLDVAARRQAIEQSLARSYRGATLESLDVSGEDSNTAPLTLSYKFTVPNLARFEDGRALIEMPLYPARLGARFLQRATRETPLLVPSPERVVAHVEITPPEGMKPVGADSREVKGAFGSYTRGEKVAGRTLVRDDHFELSRQRIAPARYADFARFAGEVDDAQAQPMAFSR